MSGQELTLLRSTPITVRVEGRIRDFWPTAKRRRNAPGRSAQRRHAELSRAWRRRYFGRWIPWAAAGCYAVVLLAYFMVAAPNKWDFAFGGMFGAVLFGAVAVTDALRPEHIARWERGYWGELSTGRELKRLERGAWIVRHDVATSWGGNRDHIVAGPCVFLLDSKNLSDSSVAVDGTAMRVTRLDDSRGEYVQNKLVEQMRRDAKCLERELREGVGFGVAVYPVVVVWAKFPQRAAYAGEVAFVRGDLVSDWLVARPHDLRDDAKRAAVGGWVSALPSA